ncbi:MAG TPA: hypothetical protein VGN22_15715, partial [Pseudonocardia sp.]
MAAATAPLAGIEQPTGPAATAPAVLIIAAAPAAAAFPSRGTALTAVAAVARDETEQPARAVAAAPGAVVAIAAAAVIAAPAAAGPISTGPLRARAACPDTVDHLADPPDQAAATLAAGRGPAVPAALPSFAGPPPAAVAAASGAGVAGVLSTAAAPGQHAADGADHLTHHAGASAVAAIRRRPGTPTNPITLGTVGPAAIPVGSILTGIGTATTVGPSIAPAQHTADRAGHLTHHATRDRLDTTVPAPGTIGSIAVATAQSVHGRSPAASCTAASRPGAVAGAAATGHQIRHRSADLRQRARSAGGLLRGTVATRGPAFRVVAVLHRVVARPTGVGWASGVRVLPFALLPRLPREHVGPAGGRAPSPLVALVVVAVGPDGLENLVAHRCRLLAVVGQRRAHGALHSPLEV